MTTGAPSGFMAIVLPVSPSHMLIAAHAEPPPVTTFTKLRQVRDAADLASRKAPYLAVTSAGFAARDPYPIETPRSCRWRARPTSAISMDIERIEWALPRSPHPRCSPPPRAAFPGMTDATGAHGRDHWHRRRHGGSAAAVRLRRRPETDRHAPACPSVDEHAGLPARRVTVVEEQRAESRPTVTASRAPTTTPIA